jgi:hypothetical protein
MGPRLIVLGLGVALHPRSRIEPALDLGLQRADPLLDLAHGRLVGEGLERFRAIVRPALGQANDLLELIL